MTRPIGEHSIYLTENQNCNITIRVPENENWHELNSKINESSCKQRIFHEIDSCLRGSVFKFTGKLSPEHNADIVNIVKRALGIETRESITIEVERKPTTGLALYDMPPFEATGEPEEASGEVYYEAGEIINPDSDQDRQMIFVQKKRFGVEPGFEAVFIRDLLPGGAAHQKALTIYHNHPHSLGFDQWINSRDGRAELLKGLAQNARTLNSVLYFVKMDYRQEGGAATVAVPTHRAKNSIHRATTAGPISEKNESAMLEVMSNDVYRALGFASQEAYIIPCKYPSGEQKLLVASKCVTGKKGEKWETFHGTIKYGQLNGNRLVGEDKDGNFKIYKLDEEQLATAKNAQRALGDRDGVGSAGLNIGYYIDQEDNKAVIVNIDPGKSLEASPDYSYENIDALLSGAESSNFGFLHRLWINLLIFMIGRTDRMRVQDLQTDCTFAPLKSTLLDHFQSKYVNFSMFDDITLAENIKGIRSLLENRMEADEVFEEYKRKFADNADYVSSINEAQVRFNERLDMFQLILHERLALPDKPLTVLENLEKLTSRTTNIAAKGKDWIALRHLKTLPGARKEWHCNENDDGTYRFWFETDSDSERNRVLGRITAFNSTIDVAGNGKTLEIKVKPADIDSFLEDLQEDKIAQHKSQFLFPEGSQFVLNHETFRLSSKQGIEDLVNYINNERILKPKQAQAARGVVRGAVLLKITKLEASISADEALLMKLNNRHQHYIQGIKEGGGTIKGEEMMAVTGIVDKIKATQKNIGRSLNLLKEYQALLP